MRSPGDSSEGSCTGSAQVDLGGEVATDVGCEVALLVHDARSGGPLDSAFGAGSVAARHEDPVHPGGSLRDDDYGWALGDWTRYQWPVGRYREKVGSGQRQRAGVLGEFEVVADQHADPSVRGVDDRRALLTTGEQQLLAVPQVRFAIHRTEALAIEGDRAVVDAVASALGEATTTRAERRIAPDHSAIRGSSTLMAHPASSATDSKA
jgi:hypothetical protein